MAAAEGITIIYWGIKARAYPAQVIAAYTGLKLKTDSDRANTWPADQPKTWFGALPMLEDGAVTLNQSIAITNYVGRKAGIQGETDSEFGISQMLISECNDIFEILNKAQYAEDKKAAWKEVWEEKLAWEFHCLTNIIGDKETFTGKYLTGDLSIWATLDIIVSVKADALEKFPKLDAFYKRVLAAPGLSEVTKMWSYYKPE